MGFRPKPDADGKPYESVEEPSGFSAHDAVWCNPQVEPIGEAAQIPRYSHVEPR